MISFIFDYLMLIFGWLPDVLKAPVVVVFSVLLIVLVGKLIKWIWDLIPML